MSSNGDCSLRQDLCGEVDDEGSLSSENQHSVGHKHDCFYGNGTHEGQVKNQLEEELERLVLIMTENKYLVQDTLTCIQETDEELKMNLTILRAHLKKRSNVAKMPQEEVINWDVMEQRIITALTGLARCQEKLKLSPYKVANLRELFQASTQMQTGREKEMVARTPVTCYYCYEKGHYKAKCPHLYNRNQWMQTPAFKQKMAFRQKYGNEMHEITSMSWPPKENNAVNGIITGQNGRDNARVSHNPLI